MFFCVYFFEDLLSFSWAQPQSLRPAAHPTNAFFLTSVAPFKINRLSNDIRLISKQHCNNKRNNLSYVYKKEFFVCVFGFAQYEGRARRPCSWWWSDVLQRPPRGRATR